MPTAGPRSCGAPSQRRSTPEAADVRARRPIKDVDVAREARARARRLQRPARRGTGHRRHAHPRGAADDPLPRRPRRAGHPDEPPRPAEGRAGPAVLAASRCGACCSGSSAATSRSSTETVGPEAEEAVARMVDGEVLMLENVRFNPGEKANDPAFAAQLAALGDIYVNDAFGAAHRAHASTEGVAALPAGRRRPAARARGRDAHRHARRARSARSWRSSAARRSRTSSASSTGCSTCVDTLVIGGGMCFTFLVAKGVDVGNSIVEPDWVEPAKADARRRPRRKGVDLLLPVDFVVAAEIAEDAETRDRRPRGDPGRHDGARHRPDHRSSCSRARSRDAKTIFWNGPMGVFEMTPFEAGTREVAMAVARNNRAVSIVGGGDSVAALKKFDLEDRVTFVSTGGGASMKLLEGAPLPGVEALLDAVDAATRPIERRGREGSDMSRMPMIAGNWKMYKTAGEGVVLVQDIAERRRRRLGRGRGRRLPAVHRPQVRLDRHRARQARRSASARRTCYWEEEGAFTGADRAAHAHRPALRLRASSATPSAASTSARPTRP